MHYGRPLPDIPALTKTPQWARGSWARRQLTTGAASSPPLTLPFHSDSFRRRSATMKLMSPFGVIIHMNGRRR